MFFDLYDFILRLQSCLGKEQFLPDGPMPAVDESSLKEAIFVVNIFHHYVSSGRWTIDPHTEVDLQRLVDWIGEGIL